MKFLGTQHFGLILALSLTACAAVKHSQARLQPLAVSAQPALRVLAQDTRLTFDTGYTRTLKAGSSWRAAGAVDQGEVYRPVGDVFTVEGAHIHEAWLVVQKPSPAPKSATNSASPSTRARHGASR